MKAHKKCLYIILALLSIGIVASILLTDDKSKVDYFINHSEIK